MVLQKTYQKLAEVTEALGKEYEADVGLARAEARLAALREHEQTMNDKLGAYERIVISHGPEDAPNQKQHKRACAAICAALDYAKTHPKATAGNISALALPLPSGIDSTSIVLVARCARIAEKFDAEKVNLTGSILELASGRA